MQGNRSNHPSGKTSSSAFLGRRNPSKALIDVEPPCRVETESDPLSVLRWRGLLLGAANGEPENERAETEKNQTTVFGLGSRRNQ